MPIHQRWRPSSSRRLCAHEEALTRQDVTATVHYVRFRLSPEQVDGFAAGPAALVVAHPAYDHHAELSTAEREELLRDLRA